MCVFVYMCFQVTYSIHPMCISIGFLVFMFLCAHLLWQKLKSGDIVDGGLRVSKMAASRPQTPADCIALARVRFEKYFNHKVSRGYSFIE
jgi:hypothetical protein